MRRFLIVDDNIALAENLAEIIAIANFGEAVLAESGVQALVLAADTQFEALVSDVRMPDMSGIELFKRMRVVDPGLPGVLMAAYCTDYEVSLARHEGILCIIPKPVPIARMLELLAHARRDRVALVGPRYGVQRRPLGRDHAFAQKVPTVVLPSVTATVTFIGEGGSR